MQTQQQTRGKVVATYPYHNEQGKLVYECCRIEPGRDGRPKDFRYRRPQPDGNGVVWNLDGVEKILYRLPELLDPAKKEHPVWIVEGEKDVETLRALGFVATTSPCGAGHWHGDFGKVLRGRRVVILPDNDDAGWRHAQLVAGSLFMWHAAALWLIHLPGLPDGGDVTDWLADMKGDKKKALIEVVKSAAKWERK